MARPSDQGKTVRVEVTADDIARGVPTCAGRCAVALAMRRVGFPAAEVGTNGVYLRESRPRGYAYLPPAAASWVEDFDMGVPVEPFAFDLKVPE